MEPQVSEKVVKIRKVRQCIVCEKHFPKGTEMHCVIHTIDNYQSTYVCLSCYNKQEPIYDILASDAEFERQREKRKQEFKQEM